MYGKIKRSIAKLILVMGLTVLVASLLGLTSAPASASSENVQAQDSSSTTLESVNSKVKKGTKSNIKCDKAPGSFVAPNGITVLNTKTCFNVKVLKKMGCNTEAGKIERPAPRRDPKSKCKGRARVVFKLKYETPDCPPGYIGGKLRMSLTIEQMLKALGLSKSIATGRVDTWARTQIKILDKFKGEVTNDCVMIPIVTPPPPPPPPPTCESHPEMPECIKTPPPVTASVSCKLPPHLYFPNGNGLVFCQASKSDGSPVKLSEFSLVGDEYAHISQVETTPYSDDANTPCPSGETCFRGQVWADKVGFANFVATVLKAEWRGRMEVKADEF